MALYLIQTKHTFSDKAKKKEFGCVTSVGCTSGTQIALYFDHTHGLLPYLINLHSNVHTCFYVLSKLTLVALNEHFNTYRAPLLLLL
jgi:hypothetical protein